MFSIWLEDLMSPFYLGYTTGNTSWDGYYSYEDALEIALQQALTYIKVES